MADKKTKKVDVPEDNKKKDIIQAVKDMPKASNLVVDNVKYETVKRDDVLELLKKNL